MRMPADKKEETKLCVAMSALAASIAGMIMLIVWAFTLLSWGFFLISTLLFVGGFFVFIAMAASFEEDDESEPKDTGVETILKYTKCASCGAPLKSDTCEYCRSKYPVYRKIRSCEIGIYNN